MSEATFRFTGKLALFLPRARRDVAFPAAFAQAATLKNAIEALGVPHTEVGAVTVNGEPATLQRIVREGDAIVVSPWTAQGFGAELLFLADAHLAALARFLRMLGYDTLHEPGLADAGIREAARRGRIVLSRDRELLKCADVVRGAYVRAVRPAEQLQEVAVRFGLAANARPFTRCLECNVPLEALSARDAEGLVPERVLERHERFSRCPACKRIYWPGTHYERMQAALSAAGGLPRSGAS